MLPVCCLSNPDSGQIPSTINQENPSPGLATLRRKGVWALGDHVASRPLGSCSHWWPLPSSCGVS